jgi:hypothetical protein
MSSLMAVAELSNSAEADLHAVLAFLYVRCDHEL